MATFHVTFENTPLNIIQDVSQIDGTDIRQTGVDEFLMNHLAFTHVMDRLNGAGKATIQWS